MNIGLWDLREEITLIDQQIYRALNTCNIVTQHNVANVDDTKRALKRLRQDVDGILAVVQQKRETAA